MTDWPMPNDWPISRLIGQYVDLLTNSGYWRVNQYRPLKFGKIGLLTSFASLSPLATNGFGQKIKREVRYSPFTTGQSSKRRSRRLCWITSVAWRNRSILRSGSIPLGGSRNTASCMSRSPQRMIETEKRNCKLNNLIHHSHPHFLVAG